jgi:superfamily II DNA or RNA helicase
MELTLHPWQKECLDAWFSNHGHGMVKVVTGAGKTILALSAAQELQKRVGGNLKVKIIVPKTFMVAQWTASLVEHKETFGIERNEIGTFYGNHKDKPDKKYMLYVINSARYTLARQIWEDIQQGNSVLLIADECHHYASCENKKVFEFLPLLQKEEKQAYYSLGLSATPQTEGFSSVLVPALGPIIFTYGFSQAMASRVINSCALFNLGLTLEDEEQEKYEGYTNAIKKILAKLYKKCPQLKKARNQDFFIRIQALAKDIDPSIAQEAKKLLTLLYKRRALVYTASQRISCGVALIRRLDSHTKIIVFGERIAQCNMLYAKLSKDYPNRVVRYHSGMEDVAKKIAISRYQDGEARILVCCRALDEGFDIPGADVGIVLSSNSQERQRVQRLGRILRRSAGKPISSLFYFYLKGTVEDCALLPDPQGYMQEFFLQYKKEDASFSHPTYDTLAYQVFDTLADKQSKMDKTAFTLMKTTAYFLHLGQLRSDWLLEESLLEQKVKEASTKAELNYWLCMTALSRARETDTTQLALGR